jgi:hypothetical protein
MRPGFVTKRSLLAILMLVSSAASVMLACGAGGGTTVRIASDVTVAIKAASGGTITNDNGATLKIPANALSTDAKVTISDTGQASRPKGDVLRNGSDTFRISAEASDGSSAVKLLSPATLDLTPSKDATKNAQDLLVSLIDPTTPNLVRLHFGKNLKDGDGLKQPHLSYDVANLANIASIVVIPRLGPQPVEGPVLQVPWYYQSGLPWCVPTSLTEMLRYYDLTPNVTDPLNSSFSTDTAFANWEMAAKSGQPAGSGANYGEMDNVNIPAAADSSGTGYVLYGWDDSMVITDPGVHGNFTDFEVYVILVDTGVFGLGDRKPIALVVDYWWHSLVIVGVDGTGLYLHDSNGPIAEHFTWTDFATAARGFKTDDKTGQTLDIHTLATAVAYGYPVKPEQDRRGTVVISRRDLSGSSGDGTPVVLEWDGAAPHTHGYYFENAATSGVSSVGGDLGYSLATGSQLHYQYRIANVTNTALTYTSVAQISGPTLGAGLVTQTHTVTVPPYTLSDYITGSLTVPNVSGGVFDVKLFETDNNNAAQDVKYIRFNAVSPILFIQPIR